MERFLKTKPGLFKAFWRYVSRASSGASGPSGCIAVSSEEPGGGSAGSGGRSELVEAVADVDAASLHGYFDVGFTTAGFAAGFAAGAPFTGTFLITISFGGSFGDMESNELE